MGMRLIPGFTHSSHHLEQKSSALVLLLFVGSCTYCKHPLAAGVISKATLVINLHDSGTVLFFFFNFFFKCGKSFIKSTTQGVY